MYIYAVWDDRRGLGLLIIPAFRTGVAVGIDVLNAAGFYAPSARNILDMEGLAQSGSLGLWSASVSVALIQYSTDYGICLPDGEQQTQTGVAAAFGGSAGLN